MKKRLFLITLMVALFVCLFVISASAAEMFTSEYTSEITKFYDGTTELAPDFATNVTDKESTAVLKKADGTYVRVPAYYIFKANSKNQFDVTGSNFDFSWVSAKLGEAETLTLASLVAIEIPEGTTSFSNVISETTFSGLTELVIPSTITSAPDKLFRNNDIIKKIFVKQVENEDGTIQGLTVIPNYFADITDSSVSHLEFFALELDYVTNVKSNAFMKSALQEIRLQGPITNISGSAFASCASLKTVYINNTSDIITIGGKALAYCVSLENVTLNGFSLSDYLIELNTNTCTSTGLTVVATNVATVGTMPFKNFANLKSADISGPITSIGGSMFGGCTNLENVKIISTNPTPATCGNSMCDGLKNLKSVELHGISIGSYAFRNANGPSTMKVTLTNVGSVGYQAFYKAQNISELYISGPLTSVDSGSYRECPSLKKLTVINTGDTLVTAGNGESNPLLEEIHLEGKFTITGSPVFQNNPSLKHVYLGHGVEVVGEYAFYQCYALETMYLADTITTIGDRAIDMEASGRQTSASFMFVDENGNMDNTLPTSLTAINGHFLKHIKIANTQLIFPETFTNHDSTQAYDFEGTIYPQGFSLVYLGRMTAINLKQFYKHNGSKDVAIYLTNNTASDIKNYRVTANVLASGDIAHGTYAGINENGSLEIKIDSGLQNNINATGYVKFIFCGSDEVCFVTRVNIVWGSNTSSSWGDFVSTPVTFAQLEAAYDVYNEANPDNQKTLPAKHPILTAPEFSPADCTNDGGTRVFCAGCGSLVSFEKTEDALGHDYDIMNATAIVYADYTKNGVYTTVCLRCEHDVEETVEGSHLFEYMGISASTKGTGLCAGYLLNNDYIEAYAKLNPSFEYGVVATIITGTNKSPLADDYTGKVITTALNSYSDIMAVDVIVSGNYTNVTPDDVSAYEAYSLAMSLYVKDDGISYIWDTTEDDAGTHAEVTTTTIYMEKATA